MQHMAVVHLLLLLLLHNRCRWQYTCCQNLLPHTPSGSTAFLLNVYLQSFHALDYTIKLVARADSSNSTVNNNKLQNSLFLCQIPISKVESPQCMRMRLRVILRSLTLQLGLWPAGLTSLSFTTSSLCCSYNNQC
jgi:hypothetical protein